MTTKIIYFYSGWLEPASSDIGLQMVFIDKFKVGAEIFCYGTARSSGRRAGRSLDTHTSPRKVPAGLKQLVVDVKTLDARALPTQMLVEALFFDGRVASNTVK